MRASTFFLRQMHSVLQPNEGKLVRLGRFGQWLNQVLVVFFSGNTLKIVGNQQSMFRQTPHSIGQIEMNWAGV